MAIAHPRSAMGAALLAVLVAGCTPLGLLRAGYLTACPAAGPEPRADRGLTLPPFTLGEHYAAVRSFAGVLEVAEAGHVIEGNRRHPVFVVTRRGRVAARRMLVVAGLHGDERTGVLAVPRLLAILAAAPPAAERWDVHAVPAANPVGLVHGSRYDGQGCDINRDFATFRTVEARLLRRLIDTIAPDVIVALKESPQDGFMVIVTATGSPALGAAAAAAVRQAGVPLATRNFLGWRLAVPGLWVEGSLVARAKTLLGMHTLGWYAQRRGIATYTMEAPWASPDVERRVLGHVAGVLALLAQGAALPGEPADGRAPP